MEKYEKIILIAEKIPGYYGYRPSVEGTEVVIKEMMFRLEDREKETEYSMILFSEDDRFVEGIVDVRFSDGSVVEIQEEDEDFKDIISYKNRILSALNRVK